MNPPEWPSPDADRGSMNHQQKRVRPSIPIIAAWCLLGATLCTVVVALALNLGLWQTTESFRGPFTKEAGESSRSYFITLGKDLRPWLTTGGDTPDAPFQSNLSLWIAGKRVGPPHTIHEEIRKVGGGRYSHWGDRLIFSLLEGSDNSYDTYLVVTYSPRMAANWSGFAWLGLVLAAMFLAGRSWLLDRQRFQRQAAMPIGLTRIIFLFLFRLAALAAAAYFASIAFGMAKGYFLPTTAVFRVVPGMRELALYEPALQYVIALLAMVGAMLSWLADESSSIRQSQEAILIRTWNRYGLVAVTALFFFSVGAMWAGIDRPADLQSNAIGGLVPFFDGHGYFQLTFVQAISGHWTPLAEQRPFAAAHRSVLMFLVGYSNTGYLLLQSLLLAVVTYFATRAVMGWRGVWAGLTFLALTIAMVRPYLPTHLTEPIGQFWSLLAIPFVINLLRRGSLLDGAASYLSTTLSLLTRMGSMFTIPAFGLWLLWAQARDAKRLRVTVFVLAASLGGCALASLALLRLYGSETGFLGSNFSLVICGATHGGNWTRCQAQYKSELERIGPAFSAEQAQFLYAKAWEAFRNTPSVMFGRLIEGERLFAVNILGVVLAGYTAPAPHWFPQHLWKVVAFAGLGLTWWRGREPRELSFWLVMWSSILASAPLVIFDDGWRVLSSVYPFIALFLASGFATVVGASTLPAVAGGHWTPRLALAGVVGVMSLWMTIPGFAHWRDPFGAHALQSVTRSTGEVVILGGKYLAGIAVVPDGEPVPIHTPAVSLSEFKEILKRSGIEQYQQLVLPSPSTSFAFVSAPHANGTEGMLYIAPAEVLYRRDVIGWKLTVMDENSDKPVYWLRVASAIPVLPLQE